MRRLLKWVGRIVLALVVLAALAFAVLSYRASSKMSRHYSAEVQAIPIPTDAASLVEGKRLATVYCSHCHKADFAGGTMIDGPLATLDALNLTPGHGSATAGYTDTDWIRTLRHGIKKDGRSLMIMPSEAFARLSDEDLGAIVAYLKSAPAVDRELGKRELHPLGKTLVGLGVFDKNFPAATIVHDAPRPAPPVKAVSVAWGSYLVNSFGCYHCHADDFGGAASPNPKDPYAPNLTQGGAIKAFTEETFPAMIRTRSGPGMPWSSLQAMTDDELRSIRLYLASLPAVDRHTPPAKSKA